MRSIIFLVLFLLWTGHEHAVADERIVVSLEEYYAIVRGEQVAMTEGSTTAHSGTVVNEGVMMGFRLRRELEVVDGRPHGREFCVDEEDKVLLERQWVDGVRHGLEIQWEGTGWKRETIYVRGKKHGVETGRNEDGRLLYVIHWEDDKQSGLETHWHKNGNKASELNWVNGKRVGKAISWHQNGVVECMQTYIDDIPQGEYTCWHVNGVKSLQGNWLNGRKNGLLIKWSAGGQLVDRACYKNGDLVVWPGVDLWPEDQPCPPE